MAQAEPKSVTVLQYSRVSPPPKFIPPSSPPLNFFDFLCLVLPPVQRLFFYNYHHNYNHFMNTTLPDLKNSLSLTLQHFYPLAGTLTWPSQSKKPEINIYKVDLGITMTAAESGLDFDDLVGNHPRDVNEFFPLVPDQLPSTQVDAEAVPIMALQVTLFPNKGICIGISSLHTVADGMTTSHFMKSWASVSKSGLGDMSCLQIESLPFYDRSLINGYDDLGTRCLNEWAEFNISQQRFYIQKIPNVEINKVRATFSLRPFEVQKMKGWILDKLDKLYNINDDSTRAPLHLSTFVLTLACVWVSLTKVLENDQDEEHLSFAVDCRERLNPPLPKTYFGNCLMPCFVDVKRDDLMGENGIVVAVKAIGYAIQRMVSNSVLVGGDNMFTKLKYLISKPRFFSIAGSPKLGVYDTDFGWGRPKKVEVISIDTSTGAMSLSECQDGKGGLEIGLVLNKIQMDVFASLFSTTINALR